MFHQEQLGFCLHLKHSKKHTEHNFTGSIDRESGS